eukprot:scaffold201592_cov69-Attheya_sp.AAC.2
MSTAVVESAASNDDDDYGIGRERKSCHHYCYPSSLLKCCACEDRRPYNGHGYECYVDGVGYTTTAARDDGYCPICNTKNYKKWMARVQRETARKRNEDEEKLQLCNERAATAEKDRVAASDKAHGCIEYSNGNVYVGDLLNGEPHGSGRLDYCDNDDDILSYQGEWTDGKHEGMGRKEWMDNVWY